MIPLLLCKDPACNQKASRETKIITKEWHSEMRAAGEATSRKTEVEMCDNCGKVQARAEEGSDTHSKELKKRLQRCSRCFGVKYCSRECQREHWKAGHKKTCVPVTGGVEEAERAAKEARSPGEIV